MSSHLVTAMRTMAFLVFAFGVATALIVLGDLPPSSPASSYMLVLAQTLGLYLVSAVGLWAGAEIVNTLQRKRQTL